jgi:hypothetical protein
MEFALVEFARSSGILEIFLESLLIIRLMNIEVNFRQWSRTRRALLSVCWGPLASEGPQRHNLTMFSKYASRYLRNQVVDIQKRGQDEAWLK